MKKFKWSVTTTFFLTFSSVVALVSVPIVIKLSSNKLITNVESHQQDGNAIGYDTFAPNKNNQLSGVQGQTITLSYLVSPEIRSFLVLNRQTNDTILVGQIKQKTKLEFKLTLPFNQTSLQLGIWLYPSSSLAVSIWHTKPVGVVSYAMKYVDVKILQPYAEQLTKTTISSNLTNQNFSISSTIPKIINAPFNETPTYYWQNTIDQSLIQTHTTDDGQKLLFPEDEIAKNYGQTYRLIAKFDKYNKAIDVSGSSFTIIKPIKYPANQENKPINENKIKNKSNNFFDQLPSNIKISSNLRGVLGQRVNLKVNFYEVANSSNVNFKLLDNLGANYQFKLQVNKGYNELIIPVYLPFNKTQETYILEIEWNNKKYISKIPTTILLPKANDLKIPRILISSNKIKGLSVVAAKIENAPIDDKPTYYWQNVEDTSILLPTIKNNDFYTLPENKVSSILNKRWQLVAKYKNLNQPIVVSNSVLVSTNSTNSLWWVIPVMIGIIGISALSLGLVLLIKFTTK